MSVKKIITLCVLVIALITCLTACGSSNTSEKNSGLDALFSIFSSEIALQKGDIRIVDCNGSITDRGTGYVFFDYIYTVKNDTSDPLNIILFVAIQDENGNVLGSSNASSRANAPAGKENTLQGTITLKAPNSNNRLIDAYCIVPEAFWYDSDNDNWTSELEVVEGDIKDFTIIIK